MINVMTLHLQKMSLHSQPKPNPEDFHVKPDVLDIFNALSACGMNPHDNNKDFPSFLRDGPHWWCVFPGKAVDLDWSLIPYGMLMTHVGDSENDDNYHCVAVRFVDGKYFIICGALGAKILKASPKVFEWCLNDNRGQEHLCRFLNIPFEEDRVE